MSGQIVKEGSIPVAKLAPIPEFSSPTGESLVVDSRARLRPAEMVERKLVNLLQYAPMPVSNLQAAFRKR